MKSYISLKDHRQRRFMAVLTVINIVIFLVSCFMFFMTAKNVSARQPSVKPTEATTVQPTTVKASAKKTKKTSSKTKTTSKKQKATAAPTEPPTEKPTQAPKATEPVTAEVSGELADILTESGYSADSLKGVYQLVTVQSDYNQPTLAAIKFFEVRNGKWEQNESLFCYGYVGSEGTVDEMSEQISGTPKGLFGIGEAFYQGSAPSTGLKKFKITNDTYWVDDPSSQYYNQKVEGTANKDWSSAEHMIDSSLYKYGFVINYNMPATPGAGSAIFFHIGSGETAGCVATDESSVLDYLSALKSSLNPHILIH